MHLRGGSGEGIAHLRIFGFIADDGVRNGEFAGLSDQEFRVAARRDDLHFETVRMLPDHVQRLAADGSRRPEDGDSLALHFP